MRTHAVTCTEAAPIPFFSHSLVPFIREIRKEQQNGNGCGFTLPSFLLRLPWLDRIGKHPAGLRLSSNRARVQARTHTHTRLSRACHVAKSVCGLTTGMGALFSTFDIMEGQPLSVPSLRRTSGQPTAAMVAVVFSGKLVVGGASVASLVVEVGSRKRFSFSFRTAGTKEKRNEGNKQQLVIVLRNW